MGITNTIASSTSTTKAQQQSPTTKQATMNKSVGLALLALVCHAQASAALPFSSPHTEAEKFREKGRRAIHQLDLKMDELHTAIELRKAQRLPDEDAPVHARRRGSLRRRREGEDRRKAGD